jgi:hypothetical protein
MSTDIPKARRILQIVLDEGDIGVDAREQIEEALSMMTRSQRFAGRGAHLQRVKITPDTVEAVKRAVRRDPDLPFEKIGRAFGIAGGRVSEIMNGLRDTPDGSLRMEEPK